MAWTIIAFMCLGAWSCIQSIGKPRVPMTANVAASCVMFSLAVSVAVYWLWRV